MGVYGIAVLNFVSSGISVILILICGIAVSSSPTVCGFSSFWLTVFGKRRSFTVLRCLVNFWLIWSYCYRILPSSPLGQYLEDFRL